MCCLSVGMIYFISNRSTDSHSACGVSSQTHPNKRHTSLSGGIAALLLLMHSAQAHHYGTPHTPHGDVRSRSRLQCRSHYPQGPHLYASHARVKAPSWLAGDNFPVLRSILRRAREWADFVMSNASHTHNMLLHAALFPE